MASKAAAKVIGGPVPVIYKYTLEPKGVWARIRDALAVSPNRSTGVPLNAQFRNPPPGANDPRDYTDPVTLPAGDIADNPYWKRDERRAFPRPSVITPGDTVGLLTLGSQARPIEGALPAGAEGEKRLVAVKEEGERGLATFLMEESEKVGPSLGGVLSDDGLPPRPVNMNPGAAQTKHYQLEDQQSYEGKYPCRSFS